MGERNGRGWVRIVWPLCLHHMSTLIVLQWNNYLHGPKVIIVSEGLPSSLLYFVHEDWTYINRWGALCCSKTASFSFVQSKRSPLCMLQDWPTGWTTSRSDLGTCWGTTCLTWTKTLLQMHWLGTKKSGRPQLLSEFETEFNSTSSASPPAFMFCWALTEHFKSIAPYTQCFLFWWSPGFLYESPSLH